jgi:hypothetical protein
MMDHMVGFCEDGNEHSSSMKDGVFLDELSDYLLKDSALWWGSLKQQ